MMSRLHFILICVVCFTVSGCQSVASKQLHGIAFETTPLINAQVILLDAKGKIRKTYTDSNGQYNFALRGITAPILMSVAGGDHADCINNNKLRPICMAAFIDHFSSDPVQLGNINPLSDRIVSDIAVMKGFVGPQQWINSKIIGEVQQDWVDQALLQMQKGFGDAFMYLGIENSKEFNPVAYPLKQHNSVSKILSLIHHNRNYDNNSGQTGHTTLTDISFRPIVSLFSLGEYEPFNFIRANDEFIKIKNAKIRIFIIGDSTSAVYEKLRFPRMGWGQALAEKFSNRDDIVVVVGSRAGRSSRDFYNGRWFSQMEPLIQKGDYLFINHGHNDQNCDSSKPIRGAADVYNLCTYPNDGYHQLQFSEGKSAMSFQVSLENYIRIARKKSAYPVLLTPTTRIKNAAGQQTTPVVHSHLTKQYPGNGYLFVGDYTQTIKDTAQKNQVPLIDLETKSIEFVNSLDDADWRHYWLGIDPEKYPFYANGVPGSVQQPDGTHFQKVGAYKMAELVLQLIKENSELSVLAKMIEQ